jgi:hypothetical protein
MPNEAGGHSSPGAACGDAVGGCGCVCTGGPPAPGSGARTGAGSEPAGACLGARAMPGKGARTGGKGGEPTDACCGLQAAVPDGGARTMGTGSVAALACCCMLLAAAGCGAMTGAGDSTVRCGPPSTAGSGARTGGVSIEVGACCCLAVDWAWVAQGAPCMAGLGPEVGWPASRDSTSGRITLGISRDGWQPGSCVGTARVGE